MAKIMTKRLVLFLAMANTLTACALTPDVDSEIYSYVKEFTNFAGEQPGSMSIDPDAFVYRIFPSSKRISYAHTLFPAKFCSDVDEYICFESPRLGLHFAIPKRLNLARPTWVLDEVKYSVRTGKRAISILGKSVDAIEVVGESGSSITNFLYSEEAGLIAFSVLYPENTKYGAMYWLESDNGFGKSQVKVIGQFDSRPEDLKQGVSDLAQIRQWIDAGENMEVRDEYGQTPLLRAAAERLWDAVVLFLKSGAKHDVTDRWGTGLEYYFETDLKDVSLKKGVAFYESLRTYCEIEMDSPSVCSYSKK